MKQITFLSLLLGLVSACQGPCKKGSGDLITETRNVGTFTKVSLSGSYTIILRQEATQKVEVKADDNLLPYIITETKGNTLEIRNKNNVCFRREKITVYISVPTIECIKLSGSGKVTGENTFTGNKLEVILSGSGDIDLDYNGTQLESTLSGSGNINLRGSSTTANYRISGSGDIKASGHYTQDASVILSGSGKCELNVQNSLNATLSGSGDIEYYGNPTVNSSTSGSGKITKK